MSTSLAHMTSKWQNWDLGPGSDLDTPACDDQAKTFSVWPLHPGVPLVSVFVMFSILLEASLTLPHIYCCFPTKEWGPWGWGLSHLRIAVGLAPGRCQWMTRMQQYQEVLGHILGFTSTYIISLTWTIDVDNTSLSELALQEWILKSPTCLRMF